MCSRFNDLSKTTEAAIFKDLPLVRKTCRKGPESYSIVNL